MDHSIYDKRRYPIVGVREGYAEWASRYEQTVYDEMDLRLLERLRTVDWSAPRSVLDLACGTGRIGAWLRRRCPAAAAIPLHQKDRRRMGNAAQRARAARSTPARNGEHSMKLYAMNS